LITFFYENIYKSKKVEQKKKLFDEILPRMFKLFEEKLVKTNTGYLVGNTMTLADIYLIATLEKLGEGLDPILGNFPKLFSLDKRVKSHPKIAEWIAKRPNTPM
jgi:glutathione S-transferase